MGMHRYMNDDYSGWKGTPTKEELMTQENKPQHTELPWKWIEHKNPNDNETMGALRGANNEPICDFGDCARYYPSEGKEPEQVDIDFILTAVNSHYDLKRRAELVPSLLVALKAMVKATDHWREDTSLPFGDGGKSVRTQARDLITKAEALEGK